MHHLCITYTIYTVFMHVTTALLLTIKLIGGGYTPIAIKQWGWVCVYISHTYPEHNKMPLKKQERKRRMSINKQILEEVEKKIKEIKENPNLDKLPIATIVSIDSQAVSALHSLDLYRD